MSSICCVSRFQKDDRDGWARHPAAATGCPHWNRLQSQKLLSGNEIQNIVRTQRKLTPSKTYIYMAPTRIHLEPLRNLVWNLQRPQSLRRSISDKSFGCTIKWPKLQNSKSILQAIGQSDWPSAHTIQWQPCVLRLKNNDHVMPKDIGYFFMNISSELSKYFIKSCLRKAISYMSFRLRK